MNDPALELVLPEAAELAELPPNLLVPKKLPELQLAYRIRDPGWTASLNVERLALSVQVDSLHLFSIGEGIAYGSVVASFNVEDFTLRRFRQITREDVDARYAEFLDFTKHP